MSWAELGLGALLHIGLGTTTQSGLLYKYHRYSPNGQNVIEYFYSNSCKYVIATTTVSRYTCCKDSYADSCLLNASIKLEAVNPTAADHARMLFLDNHDGVKAQECGACTNPIFSI